MLANDFVDTAKVMSKGQVTIPKDVRNILGIGPGSRVSFIVENGTVRIVNSMFFSLKQAQKALEGEAKKIGFDSEDVVAEYISQMRRED